MRVESRPGREELSESWKRKDAVRGGVMLGASSLALTSALFGDKATMVVSGITVFVAAAPDLRDMGKAAVNEVRRRAGRGRA